MEQFVTKILLLSFVSLAVFGIFAMIPESPHDHSNCLGTFKKPDCIENSFVAAGFHLNSFRSFSTAVFAAILSLITLSFFEKISTFMFAMVRYGGRMRRFGESPPLLIFLQTWLVRRERIDFLTAV
jgi:hypothetical protein